MKLLELMKSEFEDKITVKTEPQSTVGLIDICNTNSAYNLVRAEWIRTNLLKVRFFNTVKHSQSDDFEYSPEEFIYIMREIITPNANLSSAIH